LAVTEEEIIKGCKAGDRQSQKALYTRFSAKMYGVCLRYSKNREEAEDLLQDGFVKVFHNIQQYAGAGSFEGWIRRIMVNTALEFLRRKKLEFSSFDVLDVEDSSFENAPEAFSKIALNDLLTFIQQMPRGYQTVFNLFAIEGYSHKEIGEMLNISEGTSRSQLARARQILQEKLKDNVTTGSTVYLKYSSR
jgi:RNA polymerase sigma factor (sigma-70 family)